VFQDHGAEVRAVRAPSLIGSAQRRLRASHVVALEICQRDVVGAFPVSERVAALEGESRPGLVILIAQE